MAARISGKNNVKIFVLYLMRNVNYPMTYITINDIVMQTDYVFYLDFNEAFHEMLDLSLIEQVGTDELGDPLYAVTHRGRIVAEELKSDILPSILEKSISMALRYLDFKRRGVDFTCEIERRQIDQTFDVTVTITEHDKILLRTVVNVESEIQAIHMKQNFYSHPEVVYHGSLSLLSGNVNYIYDKQKE